MRRCWLSRTFLAFEVDLTVEHPELLAHDFLLSAVGMKWITSHKSGSSKAMTSSTTPRSSGPTHVMRASRSSVALRRSAAGGSSEPLQCLPHIAQQSDQRIRILDASVPENLGRQIAYWLIEHLVSHADRTGKR